LDDVNLAVQVVDAAGAVFAAEHFAQAQALAGAKPDGRLVFVGDDLDQREDVVGGRDPFGGAGEAAQDDRDPDRAAWVVGDDLVNDGGVHDGVEKVEVGLHRGLRDVVMKKPGDPFEDVGYGDRANLPVAEVWVQMVTESGVDVPLVVERLPYLSGLLPAFSVLREFGGSFALVDFHLGGHTSAALEVEILRVPLEIE
jgi:hypothetical protein